MYKFAIIGCGQAAEKHAEEISRIGKLTAVCDVIPSKAEKLAGAYGATAYHSIDELLKNQPDVDVVTICTPNGYHAEHSIKSLQAGKHVVCETPFCLTKAGAWQTIETEKFCRRMLLVADPLTHNEALKEFKTLLSKKAVANFELKCEAIRSETYNEWRGQLFPGGGALYTAFSEGITALLFLFGPVEEISGSIDQVDGSSETGIENGGSVQVRMQNGMEGSIRWSFGNEELMTLSVNNSSTSMLNITTLLQQTRADFYAEFYDQLPAALSGNAHSLTNLFEAVKTVEAIEKIYRRILPNTSPDN